MHLINPLAKPLQVMVTSEVTRHVGRWLFLSWAKGLGEFSDRFLKIKKASTLSCFSLCPSLLTAVWALCHVMCLNLLQCIKWMRASVTWRSYITTKNPIPLQISRKGRDGLLRRNSSIYFWCWCIFDITCWLMKRHQSCKENLLRHDSTQQRLSSHFGVHLE